MTVSPRLSAEPTTISSGWRSAPRRWTSSWPATMARNLLIAYRRAANIVRIESEKDKIDYLGH